MSGQVTRVAGAGARAPSQRRTASEPDVEVLLLGPLEVTVGGAPVDLGGRRPRALLAILALAAGRVVPLDQLVDEVWSGAPPASGVGTLQAYVSSLRRALGDRERETPVLRWRDPGYLLAVDPDRLDVTRFERLLAAAHATPDLVARERMLREALAIWRGPVLGDLADEPFVRPAAARLDDARVSAIEDLAETCLAAGSGADLVTMLEAAVADDPLRERLAACLVRALYRTGRQADALAAYDRVRRALADELGIDPSPALAALHQQVLRQDPALDAPAARPRPAPASARAMPVALGSPDLAAFVGRDAELRWLHRQWDEPAVRVAVLVGEPGIGKTRLATEFARERYAAGARVLWGRAPRDPLTPYQPFVEALRPVVAADPDGAVTAAGAGAGMLTRLFPELRAGDDVATDEPDRWLLFEAVCSILTSADAPVLLVLDDVQWLDASTASLLAHLARRQGPGRVLVLATQRADEETPGPVATALADLRRDRLVETLQVGGLPEPDAVALVSALGGTHGHDLHQRAGGNPFFLEELVRAGDVDVPDSVRDVLTERLRRLEDDAVRVLAAAAVLGDEIDSDLLGPTSGVDEPRIVDVLDTAIRAHLLVDLAGGRVGFAHALTRQTLLDGLTGPRRTALHRAAAAAVERLRGGALGEHLAEIAHHLVEAGSPADRNRAVWFLHQAAERDLQRLAYAEAAAACTRALQILDQRPDSTARLPVLLTLGRALTAAGELGTARAAYEEAAGLARDLGRIDDYATAALGVGELAAGIGFEFGLVDEALVALLEDALAAQPEAALPTRAMLAARLAVACYNDDDATRRETHASAAVAAAERAGIPPVLVAALVARHTALWRPDGDLDERLAVAERGCAEAARTGDVGLRLLAITAILPDLLESGRLAEFDSWWQEFRRLAAGTRSPQWQWLVDVALAGRLLWQGRYDEGRDLAESAFHAAGGAQGRNPPQTHTMQLFLHARDLGALAELLPLARERTAAHPGVPTMRAQLAASLAAAGDTAAAGDELTAVRNRLATPGARDFLWLATACLAADVAHDLAAEPAAEALYADLRPYAGRLAPLGGAGVVATVDRALGRLAATLGHWPEAAERARAAAQRAEALGGVAETAFAWADLAIALRRTGGAGAADAAERARAVAAPAGIALPGAFLAES